ncbi:hypothetical protein M8J76_001467 [Diaphorina citri]|nr:hypothetical protein M8J76_001467 [Diaphorina citri]
MSAVDSNASILSVRHYSVTPPNNLVIPVEEVIPQSREEEIITKKKTELTTTRQIQTRVKRQVVLEDGKIVEDSGPIVTTNTTEDTEKHEEQNTEHRNLGDGESKLLDELDNGNVSVVKRVNEKKVKSREEKEERLETEQVAHLGDISDDLYLKAVQSNQTRQLGRLASSSLVPTSSAPRIVHQSSKVKKVTDTEDTKHVSQLADGKLLTQSETTVEHEEVNDLQEPCEEDIEDHESVHESSHHYRKTKDQDLVEYLENGVKIGEKVKFSAENFTGAGTGNPDCLNLEPALKWETLSERIRKLKKNASPTPGTHNPQTASPLAGERSDAITQSPVDIVQEEQSRRVETSKWLDNHFGSESSASSSKNSTDNGPTSSRTTSFINVTMKSAPPTKSVSPTKLIVTPTETTILPSQASSPFYRGITEWKSSIPELSADIKDNTSTTQEWKTETDTSSEWRKLSQSKNTSLLSDGSEVKKSSVEEHTRVNRVIPIQLYRTNSSSDLPKNQVMYKPDIPSGGSLSSLPIYAEVNKKKTRFAPDPTPISRNPDPIQSDLSLQDRSKSDFYNRKIGGSAYNLNLAPNQEMGSTNGNAGGGASVKRRNSTKRASLTESFKKFVDKLRHGGKKRNSTSNNGGGQNSPDQLDRTQTSEPIVPPRSKHKNRTRKYYLGEDPYGSMYGKEKEYDSVTVYRDRPKNSGGTLPRRSSHHSNGGSDTHFDTVTVYKRKDPNAIGINRGGVQTLPRKSSLQTNPRDDTSDYETVTVYRSRGNSGSELRGDRGGIQTLPRKNKVKDIDQLSTTSNNSNINVFIVNKRSSQPSSLLPSSHSYLPTQPPPAKPTRTYRTNLLRSQSFNVTEPNSYGGHHSYLYKSNPHLDILEENVAPLKSPSIINNVTNNIRHHTILRS